ncbi:MAG TPA: FeS assembly SUF system protein [Flavobacteriales bacterium]|nr:FeS assembly SUF system protein [Flavobacteriales bacterium]
MENNKDHITTKKDLEKQIIAVLKTIFDPEIPVDIYELGLIYEIKVSDDFDVEVVMTLTSPSCPVAESMPSEVEQKVAGIWNVKSAKITLVWEPVWTKDMMSEEAMLELGFL